ncbi:uncharacterized protein [Henckelia pumila]|uniref:uncharacterized protein n=1 Tax=Henckelia pumila TaxID=405737 RepID=UPI003C6E7B93
MGHQQSCLKQSRLMICGYDMPSLGSSVHVTILTCYMNLPYSTSSCMEMRRNFTVNGTTYTKGYYLTDGIYLEWATFIKTFPCSEDPKRKLFKKRQESPRKDVERAFGELQSRWTIVRGPTRYWYRKKLKQIILACIILHNMIVEDEGGHVTNWYNNEGGEPVQPINGSNRGFQDYLRKNSELRDTQVHHQLRDDLVEHIWEN